MIDCRSLCATRILAAILVFSILIGRSGIRATAREHSPHRPAEASATLATTIEPTPSRILELEFTPVRLSPDGIHIAGIDGERSICIQSLEAAPNDRPACNPVEGDAPISPASIAWAPDSSAVAFSLDALPVFADSDIFVMDVESGRLGTLTGDPDASSATPAAGVIPAAPRPHVHDRSTPDPGMSTGDGWMDLFPSWSPDSREIAFARMPMGEDNLELIRMDRDGGSTNIIANLSDAGIIAVTGPTFWLADGTLIFSGSSDVASLWETRLGTGLVRTIFPDGDVHLPGAVAADVSADGAWISVYSARNIAAARVGEYFGLVQRATGEPQIFIGGEESGNGPILAPRFSPDARFMASIMGDDVLNLTIWNLETGQPVQILPLQTKGFELPLYGVGVTWLADGTILIPGPDESAEIVTIDADALSLD